MTEIEQYLTELAGALHAPGAARRRILHECRDHLEDSAADRGAEAAVRAFGPARDVAAALDVEVASRRGAASTWLSVAAVIATGISTLVLINGADASSNAPVAWTVVFFIAAQLAGTSAALATVQALALRRSTMSAAELALLGRRNLTALIAAGVTMFAAGAAVPGQASAAALLAGPSLAIIALANVMRVRRHTRRLDGARAPATRPPVSDLAQFSRIDLPDPSASRLLVVIAIVAAMAAFLRDTAEHATAPGAAVTAGVEAFAVVACFTLFGRTLGLWTRRPDKTRRAQPPGLARR